MASGSCSGRTVSMRPRCRPILMSSTVSCQIASARSRPSDLPGVSGSMPRRKRTSAADPTGLILPPVDVDLTAVVVLPRGSAHGLGIVLGSDGVDAAALPTDPHEFNSVLPDRLGTFPTERSARCERIDAEAEEDLR